jgi:hypothetical protein
MKLIAGEYIPWREQLDLSASEAQCEEDGWLDEMLESLDSGEVANLVQRVATPTPRFQRYNSGNKTPNWDTEFKAAQAHAQSILSRLG